MMDFLCWQNKTAANIKTNSRRPTRESAALKNVNWRLPLFFFDRRISIRQLVAVASGFTGL